MKIVADLHIHSKYSRAVSKDMTLENIALWCEKKGINVVGTGDFTHPLWFKEIKTKLKEVESGLFKTKKPACPVGRGNQKTLFMLTAEIANIYKKNGKTRRVHNVLFAPNIQAVEEINKKLSEVGNLHSDGRPMLGLDSKKLLEIVLKADERCVLVPAHIWTPWYAVLGSQSGFDSLKECFDDMLPYVFAVETGLSADSKMNWQVPFLDNISLISNSDAHSLPKLGREASVFDCKLSYDKIVAAIKSKDPKKFLYTIEFFPEEGKYFFDGHRECGVCFSPEETERRRGICPKCGRPLVVGVLNRVHSLASKKTKIKNKIPYKSLIPLEEIIAEVKGMGVRTKTVQREYEKLIKEVGTEFYILLDAPVKNISKVSGEELAKAIRKVRKEDVNISPGYDGEFGKISIK